MSAKNPGTLPIIDDKQSGNFRIAGQRSIWFFYLGTFFYWMSMYLYMPVLTVYASSLDASLTAVGLIAAAYAIPQFLFRFPIGMWSDFLGRQKILIILGGLILVLGSIGLATSTNPVYFGLSRAVTGLGAAMWVVFPIYLTRFTSEEKTGQAIGVLNFIVGGALVVTTLLGGVTADIYGEKTVFFMAAILAMLSIACILCTREIRAPAVESRSWNGFGQVTRRPLLIIVSVIGLIVFFAEFASIWSFIPIYAEGLEISDSGLGVLTMLVTGGSMAGSLAVSRWINWRGHRSAIIAGLILLGGTLLPVSFMHSFWPLALLMAVHGIGYGALNTQLMILAIKDFSPQQRSSAMGFYQAVYALGMLGGPLVSGWFSDQAGLAAVFYLSGALSLAIIGLAVFRVIPGRLHL